MLNILYVLSFANYLKHEVGSNTFLYKMMKLGLREVERARTQTLNCLGFQAHVLKHYILFFNCFIDLSLEEYFIALFEYTQSGESASLKGLLLLGNQLCQSQCTNF